MKRKLKLYILAILMIATLFVGCGVKETSSDVEESLKEVKEKGDFILGLDDSFPPMGFRAENGDIVGFDIDLAKEVAKRMDVELKIQPIDWDAKVLNLKNKDIDLIWNGLTITEERKKQIDFSKPYIESRQIIIVNSSSTINTKEDLADKIVAVQLESTGQYALYEDEKTVKSLKEVRKFSNFTEALLDLKAERVDGVIIDEIVGRYYMTKRPGVYKVAQEDFGKDAYAIGFRKGDESFLEEVDQILDEMRADGTTAEISKKWFGENIVTK